MNYYLRTLEGAPRLGALTIEEFKNKIAYRRQYLGQDVETAVYYQLLEVLETDGEGTYTGIKNYITANYGIGQPARRGLDRVEAECAAAAEAAEATRRRQKEAAQAQAAAAAEAYRAAMNAKREAEEEAARAALEAQQQEEAARAALEAQQQEEAEAAAVIIDEAQQVINEGAIMEKNEIELTPQVVNVEHEYYIIDEDENTITYQDETGKMYVEQKAGSGLGWIVAAAVGAFLLL